jgi:hypothetical protein
VTGAGAGHGHEDGRAEGQAGLPDHVDHGGPGGRSWRAPADPTRPEITTRRRSIAVCPRDRPGISTAQSPQAWPTRPARTPTSSSCQSAPQRALNESIARLMSRLSTIQTSGYGGLLFILLGGEDDRCGCRTPGRCYG